VSYRSIQDALADVAQAEAGTARSSNTKGLFMEITRYRWSVDLALHLADIGAKKKGCQRGATGQPLSTALPLVLRDGSKVKSSF
jgi:hypothetical protein